MSSTKAEGKTLRSVDEVDVIVEADGHVQVKDLDMILPHLDDEYEEFARFVDRSAHYVELKGNGPATPVYLYEYMNDQEREGGGRDITEPKGCDAIEEMMQETGIDKAIANFLGLSLPVRDNEKLVRGFVNAFNNWLVDELEGYENIWGNITLTPHDPEFSADEIRRVGDHSRIAGVQFSGNQFLPLPGDRRYDPIYEAAESHDLPVCIHSITGDMNLPQQHYWAETYAEDHMYQHPFTHMSLVTSMVFGGVFERFPDLKVVLQEAGIGYVPYLIKRMDDAYREFGYEVSTIEKPPSEYVRDNVYFCTQPLGHTADDPRHIAWMIDLVGPENVLFSADIPHPDFDTPEELFDRVRSAFDADTLNGLMGGNAVELFGLS
jgi:predicted TIM-barrel fold metal-dependent hydrolase